MARLRLSDNTLAGMGFRRVELEDGMHYMMRDLYCGRSLDYIDGVLELAHGGYAVPLRCRNRKHLEQLIKIL